MWKRWAILFVLLLGIAAGFNGCSGAAGPTLAEVPIPITLKFVEFDQLKIDITDLSGGAAMSSSKVVNPGDDVSTFINNSFYRANFVQDDVLIPITKGLGSIDIPVRSDIQAFEGDVTMTQLSDFLLDTFFGDHNVKIDFRDYDFDGDGVTEGCSGHTAALPVCVRFWLDDKQFIAWVFDEYPFLDGSPVTTVGQGRFKIFLDDVTGVSWEIAASYEQDVTNGDRKLYDAFLKGTVNGGIFQMYSNPPEIIRTHQRIEREGPEGSALKTLETNELWDVLVQHTTPDEFVYKTTARYLEGFDLWGGSLFVDTIDGGNPFLVSEQDVCAVLTTGIAVDPLECGNVGGQNIRIDPDPLFPADGHPFISTLTDSDVVLPADFSAAPPADFATLPKP